MERLKKGKRSDAGTRVDTTPLHGGVELMGRRYWKNDRYINIRRKGL